MRDARARTPSCTSESIIAGAEHLHVDRGAPCRSAGLDRLVGPEPLRARPAATVPLAYAVLPARFAARLGAYSIMRFRQQNPAARASAASRHQARAAALRVSILPLGGQMRRLWRNSSFMIGRQTGAAGAAGPPPSQWRRAAPWRRCRWTHGQAVRRMDL